MVWLSQGAAKAMGDDGGSIINITSITATTGFPRATMYGALKGAGAGMTRQLAVELAPNGIRVNAIAPGFIPTPGSLTVVDQTGVDRRESRTPLRLATPPTPSRSWRRTRRARSPGRRSSWTAD